MARDNVRPLTILTPRNYQNLMGLAASGRSVCNLLNEKTTPTFAWGPLDQFLYDRAAKPNDMVLPSMRGRFESMVLRSVERMKAAHDALQAAVQQGV